MPQKRKVEKVSLSKSEEKLIPVNPKTKGSDKERVLEMPNKVLHQEEDTDVESDDAGSSIVEEFDLPPVEVLSKLLERMEHQLPKEDRIKYDSQVRRLNWEDISFEGLSASQCQSTWMYIQKRIRRFRVLTEIISDAREWINQPWADFYKGRTSNRHPDMPKRPLSVYMYYYSKHVNNLIKKYPELSIPEVAKICSEKYSQLSEKKKLEYKEKCDEMKADYIRKMADFYQKHPEMAKGEKKGKLSSEGNESPLTQDPVASPQKEVQPQDIKSVPKSKNSHFSGAPERPFKPFDLFFKSKMEPHSSDPTFDRQECRKEWKDMGTKRIQWIKSALKNYRKYESDLKDFITRNPDYVPPKRNTRRNFLTAVDQKILDQSMGRPERPSISAYSRFCSEMLNKEDIKMYPLRERMSQISELWKVLPDKNKRSYQLEVSEAMVVYRQEYEEWFNNLNEEDQKAESDRTSYKGVSKVIKKTDSNNNFARGQTGSNENSPLPKQPRSALVDSDEKLINGVLEREPTEPVGSRKELFISEWLPANKRKNISDANELWEEMDKERKREWQRKLQSQRDDYIKNYKDFVLRLSNQEFKVYMALRETRDEEERASETEEEDSSDLESDETTD